MCSLSDYRYLKFHFDCLNASIFRSEKPMGGPVDPPMDVQGLMLFNSLLICSQLFLNINLSRKPSKSDTVQKYMAAILGF